MKTLRLALIGFGNVGQGLVRILEERCVWLLQNKGLEVLVCAISDPQKGCVYDPQGLPLDDLLAHAAEGLSLEAMRQLSPKAQLGWNALRTIQEADVDVVAELSFTDLTSGEPALTHIREALSSGRHVITTNKGPIALHFPELAALAKANQVTLGVEGTVMSGTPALGLASSMLAAAEITHIEGILNGTTNFMLGNMQAGASYNQALAQAQEMGFAEADPRGDVEGFDAAGKVVILGNILMGLSLTMADVDRTGITQLSAEDLAHAKTSGDVWKLIGSLKVVGSQVQASVKPKRLKADHPLATVSGATNAIRFSTRLLGDVTLSGPGAGRVETGYALLLDMLNIQ